MVRLLENNTLVVPESTLVNLADVDTPVQCDHGGGHTQPGMGLLQQDGQMKQGKEGYDDQDYTNSTPGILYTGNIMPIPSYRKLMSYHFLY